MAKFTFDTHIINIIIIHKKKESSKKISSKLYKKSKEQFIFPCKKQMFRHIVKQRSETGKDDEEKNYHMGITSDADNS